MHKIGFLGHPIGAPWATYALYLKFLTQSNLVAEFHRKNVSFARKTANKRFGAAIFCRNIAVIYAIHILRKMIVDFL